MVPVRVVDGVVILRWLAVDGVMHFYPIPEAKIPEKVTIRILLHARKLKPEHISSVYESILHAHEVSYGASAIGSVDFEAAGAELSITTYASTATATRIPSTHAAAVFSDRTPEFIHPELMVRFCQALLNSGKLPGGRKVGYEQLLARRKGGPDPDPANLIPACVLFFLKYHGSLSEGIAAHRLFNKHIQPYLPDYIEELPETGQTTKRSTQLWSEAKKAGMRLEVAARAIFDPEYAV
jgi:hypothetical protein